MEFFLLFVLPFSYYDFYQQIILIQALLIINMRLG